MYKILVPLDGSAAAEAALPEAERIALDRAEVCFIHAVPSLPLSESPLTAGITGLHDQALAYLEDVRKRYPRLGGRNIIRTDDPSGAICREAKESGFDMVLMVTHGRAGESNGPMGSVADAVVRQSRLPVLLVHPGRSALRPPIRGILVPLDGSTVSLEIQAVVSRIAGLTGAHVVFLHTRNPAVAAVSGRRGSGATGRPENQDETLQDFRDKVHLAGHEYAQIDVDENPIQAILNEAETLDVDLIAMSTRDWGETESSGLANLAQAILARADRPVLLQVTTTRGSGPEPE